MEIWEEPVGLMHTCVLSLLMLEPFVNEARQFLGNASTEASW